MDYGYANLRLVSVGAALKPVVCHQNDLSMAYIKNICMRNKIMCTHIKKEAL